ncbi:hypothetical protein F5Y13DRAFT_169422 [Hypoxylon sp. FL1857]|nr:hypothetical protein F5Y13DRAFT_169422 [Hypoxylon sp. FL1857]
MKVVPVFKVPVLLAALDRVESGVTRVRTCELCAILLSGFPMRIRAHKVRILGIVDLEGRNAIGLRDARGALEKKKVTNETALRPFSSRDSLRVDTGQTHLEENAVRRCFVGDE